MHGTQNGQDSCCCASPARSWHQLDPVRLGWLEPQLHHLPGSTQRRRRSHVMRLWRSPADRWCHWKVKRLYHDAHLPGSTWRRGHCRGTPPGPAPSRTGPRRRPPAGPSPAASSARRHGCRRPPASSMMDVHSGTQICGAGAESVGLGKCCASKPQSRCFLRVLARMSTLTCGQLEGCSVVCGRVKYNQLVVLSVTPPNPSPAASSARRHVC